MDEQRTQHPHFHHRNLIPAGQSQLPSYHAHWHSGSIIELTLVERGRGCFLHVKPPISVMKTLVVFSRHQLIVLSGNEKKKEKRFNLRTTGQWDLKAEVIFKERWQCSAARSQERGGEGEGGSFHMCHEWAWERKQAWWGLVLPLPTSI